MPSCALHQRVVPGIGRVAALGAQLVEQAHRPLAAREDGQQLALARQVEADDDTPVAMFDEGALRAVGQRAPHLELVGGELEPPDIVCSSCLGGRPGTRRVGKTSVSKLKSWWV